MTFPKLNIFNFFLNSGKAGGILLFIALICSLLIANSDWSIACNKFLSNEIGFGSINYTVSTWINDGLMAVFFLLVGLEIKRELLIGELSSVKKATLPIVAAIGGMLIPALIYFIINQNQATAHGWGIPMATDIAFALAVLSLLGNKVPSSLKIFLAALAIVDDLGAILVIAIFYTNSLQWLELYKALAIVIMLLGLNYFKVKSIFPYLILGIFLWYFMHHSGIHATISGVILAFTIPNQTKNEYSPLERLEHLLIKPVNFIIMPLFAFANTNISISKEMFNGLISPLSMGVFFGLYLGKTLGISLFSILTVKLKLANMPSEANWKHIMGIGMLAGIGFTMSIFISMLSFSDISHINEAKFAILLTSIFSGIMGFLWLRGQKKR